jgi:hypothetical protein
VTTPNPIGHLGDLYCCAGQQFDWKMSRHGLALGAPPRREFLWKKQQEVGQPILGASPISTNNQ